MGMLSLVILAVIFGYMFYKSEIRNNTEVTWIERSKYSDNYEYEYTNSSVRLRDTRTGEYLTPPLSGIYDKYLKDSITVLFQDNKRGFLNIYTGRILVPAQYERAWVFSEGLGAVVKDGKVGFVNSRGDVVIPFQFGYRTPWKDQVDFLFKNGHCTVLEPSTGKHGLIDKQGSWVVQPQYDYINNPERGLRIVKLNEKYGVMDSIFRFLLPIEYDWIEYNKDGFIIQKDYHKQLMAYDCQTILQPSVYDKVNHMIYGTDKVDVHGNTIYAQCEVYCYEVAGRYGLMNNNGKILTKALYTYINAISKDLFVCNIDAKGSKIVINSKGEVIKNV